MRLRLDLAYDGTDFHGWASQPRLRTVQGTLEAALAQVLRVESAPVTCAGRTDTGVHARGQVVHLDLDEGVLESSAGRSTRPPAEALLRRLNGILPEDVRVAAQPSGWLQKPTRRVFQTANHSFGFIPPQKPGVQDPLEIVEAYEISGDDGEASVFGAARQPARAS